VERRRMTDEDIKIAYAMLLQGKDYKGVSSDLSNLRKDSGGVSSSLEKRMKSLENRLEVIEKQRNRDRNEFMRMIQVNTAAIKKNELERTKNEAQRKKDNKILMEYMKKMEKRLDMRYRESEMTRNKEKLESIKHHQKEKLEELERKEEDNKQIKHLVDIFEAGRKKEREHMKQYIALFFESQKKKESDTKQIKTEKKEEEIEEEVEEEKEEKIEEKEETEEEKVNREIREMEKSLYEQISHIHPNHHHILEIPWLPEILASLLLALEHDR
jgi:hypothetical protein